MRTVLYVMNQKGFETLAAVVRAHSKDAIECVVTSPDKNVAADFHDEIRALCASLGLVCCAPSEAPARFDLGLAVGWRWLIRAEGRLVVMHDSLLPRYRGFSPLVSALINGDDEVGVTALWATERADEGPVLGQRKFAVRYPCKIQHAIETIAPLYAELAVDIVGRALAGEPLDGAPQDASGVSYSLWRDDEDYRIDWTRSAETIGRFVDAVGFPYLGAFTTVGGEVWRISDVEVLPDVSIVNRTPGKVLALDDGRPTVVCGQGLVRILAAVRPDGSPALPLTRFRTRFGA